MASDDHEQHDSDPANLDERRRRKLEVGQRIRARRKELGYLEAVDFARSLNHPNISGNEMSRWELGRNLPTKHIRTLADGLQVPVAWLLYGDDEGAQANAASGRSAPAPGYGRIADRLAGIETHLGELVQILNAAAAPDLESLVHAALRDLGVDQSALPRTSPAVQPPAAPASKPRRRRRANG